MTVLCEQKQCPGFGEVLSLTCFSTTKFLDAEKILWYQGLRTKQGFFCKKNHLKFSFKSCAEKYLSINTFGFHICCYWRTGSVKILLESPLFLLSKGSRGYYKPCRRASFCENMENLFQNGALERKLFRRFWWKAFW